MSKVTHSIIAHAGEVGLLMHDEATGKTHTTWIPPDQADTFAQEMQRIAVIAREQSGQKKAATN